MTVASGVGGRRESGAPRRRVTGIRTGVPAWLDVSSKLGHVRNYLTGEAAPDAGEQTVAVRARTQGSDITIQRAS